ncbi:MAG: hypothetical protein COW18_01080 [Zetaproteobacteria bacterium CG12_big_fil_rev_8_21_14_0_65_54_13]|nr:MAG: hypothetical protein COX55_03090 [Zetaproteobacteria bacterium CG23_combo_of_CG06-09_8_20_14_all_54_7]PIW51441.1 MAG: hypothetical protein COW18_01080 [Zetaproteobacteria bacterium CG12_big_fil_rev_8_21_14_0_65_54_13]PIX53231.1 MAG: hypothetical protein COZ50_14415 [Zetaproteobacteria bacterium CG_4_10_14_3_um_filter_54_28]PJA30579.1 MAG: hypothetical protein CO188_02895 [Zetaproteobacteria bacterium CG_4_9_14_3_um_filter_54_145]
MQVVSNYSIPFQPVRAAGRPVAAAIKVPPEVAAAEPLKMIEKPKGVWETGSFSWRDILDVINPLQHIPVISTIYRKLTGDQMGYGPRIAGDTLFGGMLGSLVSSLVSSVVNVFVDSKTGKDIGEHLVAAVQPAATTGNRRQPPVLSQSAGSVVITKLPEKQLVPPQVVESAYNRPPQALQLAERAMTGMAVDQYRWHGYADNSERKASNFWG